MNRHEEMEQQLKAGMDVEIKRPAMPDAGSLFVGYVNRRLRPWVIWSDSQSKLDSIDRYDTLEEALTAAKDYLNSLPKQPAAPVTRTKPKIDVTSYLLAQQADKVISTVLKKNGDYGSAWEKYGLAGVLVRLSDKALRLENIAGNNTLVIDESASDTLRDMIGYCLLGLLWIEQKGDA